MGMGQGGPMGQMQRGPMSGKPNQRGPKNYNYFKKKINSLGYNSTRSNGNQPGRKEDVKQNMMNVFSRIEEVIPQESKNKLNDYKKKGLNMKNRSNEVVEESINNLNKNRKPINKELNKLNKNRNNDNNNNNKNKNKMNNTQKDYFKDCSDKTQDCRLTKKELCERIKEHYVGRMELAKFILRQLPWKDKASGKWRPGGLCFDKLSALRNGKFCLSPTPLKKDMSNSAEVLKYSNKTTKQSCTESGGFFMELTEKQKKVLFTNKNRFNLLFVEFLMKIQNDYKLLLIELLNILNIMETQLVISNQALNELTDKAIAIVKQARQKCKENYEAALLALQKAELDETQSEVNDSNKLASELENMLRKN